MVSLFFAPSRGGKAVKKIFKPKAEKSAWGPYQTEMVCNSPQHHVGYRKAADAGTEFKCPFCGWSMR